MEFSANPQPQYLVACDAQSQPNTGSDAAAVKIMEGVTGDGGVSDAQIGGGSKNDDEVSPLEAVGHRYAMDGKIKQVSFVSDKYFSDLDVYLEHLRAK